MACFPSSGAPYAQLLVPGAGAAAIRSENMFELAFVRFLGEGRQRSSRVIIIEKKSEPSAERTRGISS